MGASNEDMLLLQFLFLLLLIGLVIVGVLMYRGAAFFDDPYMLPMMMVSGDTQASPRLRMVVLHPPVSDRYFICTFSPFRRP